MKKSRWAVLSLLAILAALAPASRADLGGPWVEVHSPNFRVISDAGEGKAREIAQRYEQIREIYRGRFPMRPHSRIRSS